MPNKFKQGDRVIYAMKRSAWTGAKGTIVRVERYTDYPYRVRLDKGPEFYCSARYLSLYKESRFQKRFRQYIEQELGT